MTANNIFNEWDELIGKLIKNGQSVAIGVFSTEGKFLSGNPAMNFYMGLDIQRGIYRNTIVNPDPSIFSIYSDNELIFNGLLTISDGAEISYSLEASIYRKNDSCLVFAEANIEQLFSENKKMSKLNQEVNNLQRQLIKEKITLQKTLEELKETQQMLIHSEKMNAMGKLVAGVAHELNNPIAFVYSNIFSFESYAADICQSFAEIEQIIQRSGNAELIEATSNIKDKNDLDFIISDLPELSKQTKTGIDRVKTIIEDLRKFSRLDEAELKTVDLIDNLRSTIAIANMDFSKRDISTEFQFPEKLFIECYPSQLNQAFLNVIVNAAQAIDKKGTIKISVFDDNEAVEIIFEDRLKGRTKHALSLFFTKL